MTTALPGWLGTIGLIVVVSGCATAPDHAACPAGTQNLPDCPPLEAINDPFINQLYEMRTWKPPDELGVDTIELGKRARIPVQHVRAKFVGATSEDALNSLAAKFWLIENARHTIDATYYIFKRDLIGEALLGALCNAVKRGVDVRFIVDSLGSVVIFNAFSKVFVNFNRRSHDKLLVVDGSFPDGGFVMTGGRNISLSYYSINADGSPNPDTYMDAEILLRTGLDHEPGNRLWGNSASSISRCSSCTRTTNASAHCRWNAPRIFTRTIASEPGKDWPS